MASLFQTLFYRDIMFDPSLTSDQLRSQWIAPSDVFSILLILGDVVVRALAQLAGGVLTPVAFSFGWVTYAISALGQDRLMLQDGDTPCKIINGRSGYIRENTSWVLGRLMRDFKHWRDRRIDHSFLIEKDPAAPRPSQAGLVVSVYKPSESRPGVFVLAFQLGIAAIPLGLFGDWGILMITGAGIILSLVTGSLPAWTREKWPCRKKAEQGYILTGGNGSQHAIIILGNGHGLNLEDLAAGQRHLEVDQDLLTRAALFVLALLWILLLITASALTLNPWFLLAVGSLGMLHKIYVSFHPRRPENFGVPLEFQDVIGEQKVMEALYKVEELYPHFGRNMLPEFFPGKLRKEEEEKWAELEEKAEAAKRARKAKEKAQEHITQVDT
ncbi:hypothetical protein BDW75DRAFT_250576 [Aspergillus navahoensis]